MELFKKTYDGESIVDVFRDVSEASKQDVTTDALVAVAEHTLAFGKPVVITNNGVPEFEITVKKFSAPEGGDK